MSPSDQIGLLPGFGWIADQEWFGVSTLNYFFTCLVVCWLITPVGHVVFAFATQAYVVPLTSDKQFQSFFPGDLFLGAAIAILLTAAREMADPVDRWFQQSWVHFVTLGVTLVAATLAWFFVERPGLTFTQWVSPSKLYHTYVLYGLYGYVGFVTLFAAVSGNWGTWRLLLVALALVVASPWLYYAAQDGQLPRDVMMYKQEQAHPSSYKLFWVIPIAPK